MPDARKRLVGFALRTYRDPNMQLDSVMGLCEQNGDEIILRLKIKILQFFSTLQCLTFFQVYVSYDDNLSKVGQDLFQD